MTDILGPAAAGGVNAVTVRPGPALPAVPVSAPTWFGPCTSAQNDDGTQVTAQWLNAITAQFRTAFSGTNIVQNNADDMLLRAIQSVAGPGGLPAHNHDDRYFTETEADSRYLRKDVSDAAAAGTLHSFGSLQLAPHATAAQYSGNLTFRQNGSPFFSYSLFSVSSGFYFQKFNAATGAYESTPLTIFGGGAILVSGINSGVTVQARSGATQSVFYADASATVLQNGSDQLRLSHNGQSQTINRSGVMRQIATEDRVVAAGQGLTGGGDLSSNRLLAIDTAWLDARIGPRIVGHVKRTVDFAANVFRTAETAASIATRTANRSAVTLASGLTYTCADGILEVATGLTSFRQFSVVFNTPLPDANYYFVAEFEKVHFQTDVSEASTAGDGTVTFTSNSVHRKQVEQVSNLFYVAKTASGFTVDFNQTTAHYGPDCRNLVSLTVYKY